MISLIIPSLFLSIFGIFTVFGIRQNLIINQLAYFAVAFFSFFIFKKISTHFFRLNSKLFYWLFVFILIITFIIGFEVKGSKRWIDLFFFKFQASEFFKIFFIIFMSEYLSRKEIIYNKATIFLKSVGYFLLPALIIFKQPDLGNALVISFIFFMMVIFSDLPKKYIIYSLLAIVLILPAGWMVLKSYQKERIVSFLNPEFDARGTGYNMIQSVITVGSGKFLGRGLGLGTQSRLFFLPENHTDFAFSSLVEQFGFIGGLTVLTLYGVIVYLLIKKAIKFYYQDSEDSRKKFLYLIGLLSYLIFQVFVNVGMNMGLFPVAGISLPFISYGGSAAVALFIGFALIP